MTAISPLNFPDLLFAEHVPQEAERQPDSAYVTFGGGALGWAFTSGRLTGGIVVEEVTK